MRGESCFKSYKSSGGKSVQTKTEASGTQLILFR